MSAEELLEQMRRKKDGYGQSHFKKLYKGFGFEERKGGPHATYIHREFRLIVNVARHNTLPRGYAETAVEIIDKFKELQAEAAEQSRIAEEQKKAR